MIKINFDPANLTGDDKTSWIAWEKKAKDATKQVLAAWEASRKNPNDESYAKIFTRSAIQEVWAELKNWLLEKVFNDKCAYCETRMPRASLHAEHYRPKAGVTSSGKRVKIKDDLDQDCNHPGYFWLAFHWTNLLPACQFCNSGNGKRNEFPIPQTTYLSILKKMTQDECEALKQRWLQSNWPEILYYHPIDLDSKEGRLLLHPYFDDPRKCLMFDDWGKVIATGNEEEKARGVLSIKVYNLNDERIITARRQAQKQAFSKYNRATEYFLDQDYVLSEAKARAKNDLAGYILGKEPYSAAVLDYLRREDPAFR